MNIKIERYKNWFSGTLLLIGTTWIGYLLSTYINSFSQVLPDSSVYFAGSIVSLGISLALPSFIFYAIYKNHLGHSIAYKNIANLYFAGQLLKYMPGKIWGIVYQIARTGKDVTAGTITRVNIDQTIFLMLINTTFAFIILGIAEHLSLFYSILMSGCMFGLLCIYMHGGAEFGFQFVRKILPNSLQPYIDDLRKDPISIRVFLIAVVVQSCSVAMYVFGWIMLSNAYPLFQDLDFVSLGMMYVLASAIGIMTMLTPAGLGVREVSFVTLSSGLATTQELAFIAVLVRLWFVFAEISVAAIMLFSTTVHSLIVDKSMMAEEPGNSA